MSPIPDLAPEYAVGAGRRCPGPQVDGVEIWWETAAEELSDWDDAEVGPEQ
jgi:hypothetical protein